MKVKREVFDIGSEPNIPRLGSMPYSTSMARHAAQYSTASELRETSGGVRTQNMYVQASTRRGGIEVTLFSGRTEKQRVRVVRCQIPIEEKDKDELIRWAESTKILPETVNQITDSYDWRSPADPICI